MSTFTGSIKTVAEKLGTDYLIASALVKYLALKGLATERGVEKPNGGKGKGSMIWSVTVPVTILQELATPTKETI